MWWQGKVPQHPVPDRVQEAQEGRTKAIFLTAAAELEQPGRGDGSLGGQNVGAEYWTDRQTTGTGADGYLGKQHLTRQSPWQVVGPDLFFM